MAQTNKIPIRLHWKGLFKAYKRVSSHTALIQSFWITIGIVGIIIAAYYGSSSSMVIALLKRIAELAIAIFPSLTGLAFAGYTIVIGTISPNILRKLSRRPKEEDYNSLLEDCNAIFSVMLLIAIFTLFIAFLILVMIECKWKTPFEWLANIVNYGGMVIMIYSICASFRSMLAVIINVFNFGQFIEYDSNKKTQ